MAIITLAAAKAQLGIDPSDTDDDAELQTFMEAVTAPLERELGRVIEQRTVIDEFDLPTGTTSVLLRSVPVSTLISIESVDGSVSWSVDPSVMHVYAESGEVTVLSGPALSGKVVFIYRAGDADVAAHHRLAGLIILQHLWETQRGAMGVNLGGEGETFVPKGYAVPRRALELLESTLPGVA
ncbi:head-tail connector protein [Streptomyces brasiliscabiei]|uniref:Head-tail connector protein n=1 Tax=Streptomyces brasiliscabiei TaxID=2736302 RepID=A0ABU8G9R2_9ACTN